MATVENFIAAQRQNAILWVPVLWALGIGLYFGFNFEPSLWSVLLAAIITLAAGGYIGWRLHAVNAAVIGLVALGCVLAGFAGAQIRTHAVAAPVLSKSLSPARVVGTIQSMDVLEVGRGTRVVLRDVMIEDLEADKTPHAVRISIRKDSGLHPGQRISVLAGLNPPSPPVSPGGYDFQRHAWFTRVGAFGFAYTAPEILEVAPARGLAGLWYVFSDRLENFRQAEAVRVRAVVAEPQASIVSALLLGERAAIPEDVWQDLRASGLAHVISISGLHISLIAGGVFFVLRFIMALFPRFALYHPIKKYAAVIALLAAALYALMVGLSVPTVRSVFMTGMVLLAIMLDRSPFSMRLVAVAAMLILVTTPEALMGPSFQMSFGAVAGMVFFYDQTRGFWTAWNRRSGWMGKGFIFLCGMVLTSVIATLATAPFTMFHFQQFPFYSVVGNVLAMPVISFVIMPAAVFSYILMPLGLHDPALVVMGWGVQGMIMIADHVASWPNAAMALKAWPLSSLLCFTAAGVVLMLVAGRARWVCVVPLVVGIILVAAYRVPDIMVAGSGKLVMMRLGDVVTLSNRRTEKFSAEAWLREAGVDAKDSLVWPRENVLERGGDSVRCDDIGCMARLGGRGIAFSFKPQSLTQDCRSAEIVIAIRPIPKAMGCGAPTQIDMWDLRNKGTHAIRLKPGGEVDVQTVSEARGVRPWTQGGQKR